MIQAKAVWENLQINHWLADDIHRWTWWLLLTITVLPWVIWWKTVDRRRVLELVLVGALTMLITGVMNGVGSELSLWDYPEKLLPTIPGLIPFDFSVLPVGYMLIYQYFPRWGQYAIVSLLAAAAYSFVGEPIMVWLGIYLPLKWSYWCSLPVYFLITVFLKWLVDRLKTIQTGK